MKRTAIVVLAVAMAVAFGIIHNLVTVQISPANFTLGHARIFPTESPTVLAILWGIVTPSVAGLIVGVPLALVATVGPHTPLTRTPLVTLIAALCVAMAIGSVAGGVAGHTRARAGVYNIPDSVVRSVPSDELARFASVRTAHAWAHRAGLAGGIVVWLYAWRLRRRHG